ncbi:uncharacterized protein [Centroberyx affinis]|uniref:uncharacterized protein n=1 Tax=Centroberyx affinis TaxID=166261 RepID=UPI003A5B9783
MAVREMFLYPLLGNLLITGVCSACVFAQCLKCNVAGETPAGDGSADFCQPCSNNNSKCINELQVSLNGSASENLQEGDEVTIECFHNLPPLTVEFEWRKDGETLEGQNTSKLTLKVFTSHAGLYSCSVWSPCGNCTSSPHKVAVNDSIVLLLVICGVSAVVLVLILAVAMKCKLKKENAEHQRRKEQRAQEQQRDPHQMRPRDAN